MYIFEIVFALDGPYLVIVIGFLIILIAQLDAIYVHFRYKDDISKRLCKKNGLEYVDGGLLMGMMRLFSHGGYCVTPWLAKRDGHYEFFSSLPQNQRYHVIFIYYAQIIGGIVLLGSYGIVAYFGL